MVLCFVLFPLCSNLCFSQNYMQGSIPASICNITGLQYLVGEFNLISGPIPTCIGALTQLK